MLTEPLALVAVAETEPSADNAVERAVAEVCDRLGGLGRFVKPGMSVLVKPNLSAVVSGRSAGHLLVAAALARLARSMGAEVAIGDSPVVSSGSVRELWQESGLEDWACRNGLRLVNFEREGSRPYPVNTRVYHVARSVMEADLVINIAGLTLAVGGGFCGAMDNLIGVLPGYYKMTYLRRVLRPRWYAHTLVDLYSVVKPGLSVLVAERNRGAKGSALLGRAGALVLASTDGVAVDAIAAHLVGIAPQSIPAVRFAAEAGLGAAWPETVSVDGDRPGPPRPGNISAESLPTRSLTNCLREDLSGMLLSLRPVRQVSKCRQCGECRVFCPVGSVRLNGSSERPDPGEGLCLSCWCCVERCPHDAIRVKKSWFAAALAGRGAKSAPSKILLDKALYSI